jgi:DNA invertase Pin-like site-specific DNA recombinase
MSEARAFTPRVTVMPATLNSFTAMPISGAHKRRVAAYARVSTDQEEQLTSYEAQVDYYTQYILSKAEWEYVKVYTDEGISATNTKKRDGFKEMVQDALDGKIDLIITKSVSRFARNTVDSLTTVRMLKEKGVEVYFEKENIFTLDSKGELLITIMSSLAQEESRSISENVTWGMRKRFADGKVALPYKQFLGYSKGADGLPEIVPDEAVIVKNIYRMFLEGKSPSFIAHHLSERGIPSPGGKINWRPNTVISILTNEKYKGDAILQKTFCTDFLTKKMKVNEGEVPQYYVEGSHPAIIEPEIFDAVQVELKLGKQPGRRNYTPHCFSGRIYCDECGELYGSKSWHSHTVWQCNARHKGLTTCGTPPMRNETIQDAFVRAFNQIVDRKEEIIQVCEDTMRERCDISGLVEQQAELRTDLEIVMELMQRHISANAHVAMDQAEYQRQYDEYEARFHEAQRRIAEVEARRESLTAKRGKLKGYLDLLRKQGLVRTFNEALWCGTVEQVRIKEDGTMRFIFKDGAVVEG